jgi:hypothetical protein
MDFEFIDEDDVQSVKRGRKSQVPTELVDLLKRIPKGKAVVLKDYAGDTKDEGYKSYKASTSATIRSAGKSAGIEVTISWSPMGVPQVRVKNTVTKKAK